jgi:aconitate hydratase
MLLPQVLGFKLTGQLPEGSTATDLVLTVTEMLRAEGVVGKFVEFYGEGLARLPLADRATIGNMSPEFGSTCAIFPVDAESLRYLEFSGRSSEQIELVEAYTREQGLFHDENSEEATYSSGLELDLGDVEPSIAGPRRPQDRVPLSQAPEKFDEALAEIFGKGDGAPGNRGGGGVPDSKFSGTDTHQDIERSKDEGYHTAVGVVETQDQDVRGATVEMNGEKFELRDGSVVIAAITSCTNTSNPSVMIGAGLVAKKAVEKGLNVKPWVKTSLAPGSMVVTEYLEKAGLTEYLEALKFHLVGYGCTTCIGNSGPLPPAISAAVEAEDLVVCSVLSGNRNFEGRINSDVKANYLASPPLCVAYALAGHMEVNLMEDPLGEDGDGNPVYLKDIWPTQQEVNDLVESSIKSDMFRERYADVFSGDDNWNALEVPEGDRYAWPESTYVKQPPYFFSMSSEPIPGGAIEGARVLAVLGDSITTDHISPAGAIKKSSPAGEYLIENGVDYKDFNSYGSRRGNHEVMMRGTFANVRLKNLLAPGTEGGVTRYLPDGEEMSIYDAAMRYTKEGTQLVVLAGKEYGSGSSRDWAAKGTRLLGVRAVIAESFERIHRSNLVGMGVLPLQFADGESRESLGLSGEEVYDVGDFKEGEADQVEVTATPQSGDPIKFTARVRIDTPNEVRYYKNGGILHFVLRQLRTRQQDG